MIYLFRLAAFLMGLVVIPFETIKTFLLTSGAVIGILLGDLDEEFQREIDDFNDSRK